MHGFHPIDFIRSRRVPFTRHVLQQSLLSDLLCCRCIDQFPVIRDVAIVDALYPQTPRILRFVEQRGLQEPRLRLLEPLLGSGEEVGTEGGRCTM